MGIKHYQEKNARAMEKELAQLFFGPYNGEIQKVIWPVGGQIFTKTI